VNALSPLLYMRHLEVDVTQKGYEARPGHMACEIDRHIKFDTSALQSFSFTNWRSDVFDALVVAAAVEFCDRSLGRSAGFWGRRFSVRVPVHSPALWNSRKVGDALIAALEIVTGDAWEFEFVPRESAVVPPHQTIMEFPRDAAAVIAYSDGMDSRAVAGLEERRLGDRLVRVRVGKKQPDIKGAELLSRPFTKIPYRVRVGRNNRETSARSRGFKFGMVAGIAAFLVNAPDVILPESGQGALAPMMIPVGQSYPDYRNHPVFTARMAILIEAIFGHRVSYRFPRLWFSKAQTLRAYVDLYGEKARWQDTRSCWQQARQVSVSHVWRQCGVCAACMLRRMSVHAAGLAEPKETYLWEDLGAAEFDLGAAPDFKAAKPGGALSEYALAGALHLDDFAALKDSREGTLISRRSQGELSRAMGIPVAEAESGLAALINQHKKEWSSFAESLGKGSFVNAWLDRS
jgi:hypothetical protein